MKKSKHTYFTKKMFYRFFFPSLVSSIGLSFGNIVDALVVGRKMGETGLAAIALVAPVFMTYNVLDVGLAIGGSLEYSRLLGEGKARQGVENFHQMLCAAIGLSVAMMVAGTLLLVPIMHLLGTKPLDGTLYLAAKSYAQILFLAAPLFFLNFLFYYYIRCDDNQRLASIGLVVGNTVDILLNILFVIGFDMGVEGAAMATVIGKAVAIAIYLPHFFLQWTILRLQLVKPNIRLIWKTFLSGFASSSEYLFQFFFYLIVNHLLLRIGGEGELAVFQVVINISYVIYAIYEGMGATLQPLVGTFYGEKNKAAMRITRRLSLSWGIILGAMAAFIVGKEALSVAGLFGLTEETAVLAVHAIRLFSISTLIGGLSIMMGFYYMAVENSRLVFLIQFLRSFAIYLFFCMFLTLSNIEWFWWTFPLTEVVSLLIWMGIRSRQKKKNTLDSFDENRILCKVIEKNEDFQTVISLIEPFCEKWSADFSQQYYVNLTVEETCQAIIEKGFTHMREGYIELTLIACEDGTFELHVRDNATHFNLMEQNTNKIACDSENGMDTIGIYMVKKKAKEFFYRRYQGFNTLMIKV
ncbi:MAG: hypothetical protein PWP24_1431 [Clostridiales bacterium]|nr:hypothetical protein [Clostridiales bacterium]